MWENNRIGQQFQNWMKMTEFFSEEFGGVAQLHLRLAFLEIAMCLELVMVPKIPVIQYQILIL